MKISYRNYPAIKFLKTKNFNELYPFEVDRSFFNGQKSFFLDNFNLFSKDFESDFYFVAKSFEASAEKSKHQLLSLFEDIAKNDSGDMHVKGTYCVGGLVYMVSYKILQGTEDMEVGFFVFDKFGSPVLFFVDSASLEIHQLTWISKTISLKFNNDAKQIMECVYFQLSYCILYHLFKSYASVETKIIARSTKQNIGLNKFVNTTDFNITHLDCRWFTNIIREHGFKVSGHFRLQPKKKDGEWTKELIWIDDFEKKGYNLKAKTNERLEL